MIAPIQGGVYMRQRFIRNIVAIVGLLFAVGQASAAICMPCPGCSPAQMLQAAVDKGQGARLVWNPTDGSIREYRVTCSVDSAGGTSIATGDKHGKSGVEPNAAATPCTGVEGAVPQVMHDVAAALLRFSNATGGTYKAAAAIRANRWSIRTQPNPSARDYLADANYRAQLHDRIEQEGLASIPGTVGEVMPYLMENDVVARAFTDHVETVVTVVFDDGSKVDV
ncbi:hypothetical protein, partial [Dokdonella sp.]|uniref:hypothetical protein n=1 Tax=Dokdonella sp. TaxID=2291710 RepID=UPI002F409192